MSKEPSPRPLSPLFLTLAPAMFVALWSTGWLAARAAMPYSEPLTFLSVRYGLAALVLAVVAVAAHSQWPASRRATSHAMISGAFLHAMYFGGVWWSVMHGLPVAISGLVTALQPILTAVLAPILLGETMTRRQGGGVALGFAGIALVLSPALAALPTDRIGELAVPLAVNVCGMLGGTLGSFYQKRFVATGDLTTVTALQNVGALVATLPIAVATESLHIEWNLQVAATMAWVVLGMSIGAVLLLSVLLRHGEVSRAATLIYLMPPLVALQAVLLLGETLTPMQMAGMAVTALGVALALRKA